MTNADAFISSSSDLSSEVFAFEFIYSNKRGGFTLLNKIGSAQFKQMRSCVTYNSQSYGEFEKAVLATMSMPSELKLKVLLRDQQTLSGFSSASWLEKHIGELKKNAKFMSQANMTGFNKGINFKRVAHQPNFR